MVRLATWTAVRDKSEKQLLWRIPNAQLEDNRIKAHRSNARFALALAIAMTKTTLSCCLLQPTARGGRERTKLVGKMLRGRDQFQSCGSSVKWLEILLLTIIHDTLNSEGLICFQMAVGLCRRPKHLTKQRYRAAGRYNTPTQ